PGQARPARRTGRRAGGPPALIPCPPAPVLAARLSRVPRPRCGLHRRFPRSARSDREAFDRAEGIDSSTNPATTSCLFPHPFKWPWGGIVQLRRDQLAHHLAEVFLELDGVGVEPSDAVGQLLGGHGVLVVHPAERLLVEVELLQLLRGGRLRRELPLE